MPIPDFQTIMLPLLKQLSDGDEHSNQDTLKSLAEHFQLTNEDLAQLLPSGLQPLFTNRVAWAKSHLKMARLIDSPRRGYYKILPRGLDVLKTNPTRVDLRVLNQFPEYVSSARPEMKQASQRPRAYRRQQRATSGLLKIIWNTAIKKLENNLHLIYSQKLRVRLQRFSKSSSSNFS